MFLDVRSTSAHGPSSGHISLPKCLHMPRFSRIATLTTTLLVAASPAVAATTAHAASARSCAGADLPATAAAPSALRSAVLCLINQQRTSRHLPRLTESHRLDRSAQSWTNQMVSSDTFAHIAGASSPMSRVTNAGYNWMAVGENIATGFATPRQVVSAWMASPGHCQNILDPQYRNVGTGVNANPVAGSANTSATWTQDFGLVMGNTPPSNNWGPSRSVCR